MIYALNKTTTNRLMHNFPASSIVTAVTSQPMKTGRVDGFIRADEFRSSQHLFAFICIFFPPSQTHRLNNQEPKRPAASKTPIQVLQEHGNKCGSLPVYVLEKAEGEAHQLSFVFSVKFGEVSCTGFPPPAPPPR